MKGAWVQGTALPSAAMLCTVLQAALHCTASRTASRAVLGFE